MQDNLFMGSEDSDMNILGNAINLSSTRPVPAHCLYANQSEGRKENSCYFFLKS